MAYLNVGSRFTENDLDNAQRVADKYFHLTIHAGLKVALKKGLSVLKDSTKWTVCPNGIRKTIMVNDKIKEQVAQLAKEKNINCDHVVYTLIQLGFKELLND